MSVAGRLGEVIATYLADREVASEVLPDGARAFRVSGTNGAWSTCITPLESAEQVLVHSLIPGTVPAGQRTEMALLLTRASMGLVLGNFELDLDTGAVRGKTSIDVEGAALTDALLDHLVVANAVITDQYLPAIEAVIDGASAGEALAVIPEPHR